jgi:hypothetical protein
MAQSSRLRYIGIRVHRHLLKLVFAFCLFGLLVSGHEAKAASCTLMKVSSQADAKLKVYFTRFSKEDSSKGKYKRCRLVRSAVAGTQTFFVTPFRKDAQVIVHKSNWPR